MPKSAKIDRQTDSQKVQKREQKCKDGRKQAKTGEKCEKNNRGAFCFSFLAIVQWPCSDV